MVQYNLLSFIDAEMRSGEVKWGVKLLPCVNDTTLIRIHLFCHSGWCFCWSFIGFWGFFFLILCGSYYIKFIVLFGWGLINIHWPSSTFMLYSAQNFLNFRTPSFMVLFILTVIYRELNKYQALFLLLSSLFPDFLSLIVFFFFRQKNAHILEWLSFQVLEHKCILMSHKKLSSLVWLYPETPTSISLRQKPSGQACF